ncbi:APC family permease [Sphingomonas jaspsi]|uniref:APC family permease n=1 Tax=Sphingomonas jaspsi TaxID=392409 RepID=UPI0004B645CD|nr:amino acid permease [Sphingomonas jaspsi]
MTDEPLPPPNPANQRLGRFMSLAMVVGTVIGSGIYLLPSTLAPYGPNLVWAFLLTGFGTMCLALVLAKLSAQMPGGPFAYVGKAFGDVTASVTMWSYLVSQWTAVAAVAIAVSGAIGFVVPWASSGSGIIVTSLAVIAILLAVNLSGVRKAGNLQVVTTLIKVIPLLAVILLVLGRFTTGTPTESLDPVPVTIGGVTAAAALMLFSLTGFEAATVTANVTEDATHTVPTATIVGTGFTAIIYLAATVATLWLLPSAVAAKSSAPFADAIAPLLGDAAGALVAAIAAVSAFGTCNALLLLSGEVARSIATAGDMPPMFAKVNRNGVPVGSLCTGAAIASLLVLASASESFVPIYVFISLLSAVSSLILYLACAGAALKLRSGALIVALLAFAYSIAMFVGAGMEATLWGIALALVAIPIRWISRRVWPSPAAAD